MQRTFLLSLLSLSATLNAQVWDQRANMGQPLLDATGFSIGNYGYMFGGSNGSTAQAYLWRYTPELDVWGAAVQFPGTVVQACAAAGVDGKGYVFGGRTGVNGFYSSELWVYDPSMFQWTQKASKPGVGLAYPSAFALNGRLYIFGGSSPGNVYTNALWEYTPDLDLWTMKASLPAAARSGAIAVASNGKGYIIGGNDASANFSSSDVWEYDPVMNSWTQKADMPGPERRVGCGFELGGLVYAGGGWDGTTRFTDFYSYDPAQNAWTSIPDYGGAGAYSPVAFATENAGYVAVGSTSTGPSAQCWAYVAGGVGVEEQAMARYQPYSNGSEIVVQGWDQRSKGRYSIVDPSGRMVAEGKVRDGRVPLAGLSAGAFVLQLTDAEGAPFIWKFVVGE